MSSKYVHIQHVCMSDNALDTHLSVCLISSKTSETLHHYFNIEIEIILTQIKNVSFLTPCTRLSRVLSSQFIRQFWHYVNHQPHHQLRDSLKQNANPAKLMCFYLNAAIHAKRIVSGTDTPVICEIFIIHYLKCTSVIDICHVWNNH